MGRTDALHCIVRTDPGNSSSNKSAHTPVYFRGFKLPAPKTATAPRVAQLMTELQIQHTRLVMPTRENCAHLESLLEAAAALVETKKLVDKVDMELKVAKSRLGNASENGEGSANGGGGGGKGTPGPMDVDEDAEGEQEEPIDGSGRGQSVVSTRSARGRKQVCFFPYAYYFRTNALPSSVPAVYVYLVRRYGCDGCRK